LTALAFPHLEPIRRSARQAFSDAIRGQVIDPTDPDYDLIRQVQSTAVDRRPALIVRPSDALDVARSVRFARDTGLPIAVRSGGHSLAGHSVADGAVVIDVRSLKGLHIDPDRRLAWAGSGLTAGEYTTAAGAHGLATPFGDAASVGLGGLTLGGGIGFLARRYGLAIDSLVSAEIVTADGRLLNVSESQHPDLFWAIRGGGGNFGVVTRFQYRLHEAGLVTGGMLVLPATRDVLRDLLPVAAAAPTGLSMISFVMPAPEAPFIPAELVGRYVVMAMVVHVGDPAEGAVAMGPFRSLATPIADLVDLIPYPAIYEFTRVLEERGAEVVRSEFLSSLPGTSVDAILDRLEAPGAPPAIVELRALGGAMADIPVEATAFAHRTAPVLASVIAPYETERGPSEALAAAIHAVLRRDAVGVYSNFLEDEGEARIHEAYPGGTYERLAAIKRRYDPSNVFALNQNIRPA
jgi:FAD/FMN-containing dehydrogenase